MLCSGQGPTKHSSSYLPQQFCQYYEQLLHIKIVHAYIPPSLVICNVEGTAMLARNDVHVSELVTVQHVDEQSGGEISRNICRDVL